MIEFSQQQLEQHCPTFTSPEAYTFQSLLYFLKAEAAEIRTALFSDFPENSPIGGALIESHRQELAAYIYPAACAKAAPQLDLIATENGFGIVSNEHIAPASPHRVKALIESLEAQAANAWSALVASLVESSIQWASSYAASRIFALLLPTPAVARKFGLLLHDTPYNLAEFQHLAPFIHEAQNRLARTISPELLHSLRQIQRGRLAGEPETRDLALRFLLDKARAYIAAFLDTKQNPQMLKVHERGLLDMIHQSGPDILPEYFNSATHRAHAEALTHPDNTHPKAHAYCF